MREDGRNRLETSSGEPKSQRHCYPKTEQPLHPRQALAAPWPFIHRFGGRDLLLGLPSRFACHGVGSVPAPAGKGGDRTGACNTCLREGFHKPSTHLPHLHRFYNNSDQTREIPIYKHKALRLEIDRSAYICMYLYIQLLKDAAENPLQGARTRQERAPAPPGSRRMPGFPCARLHSPRSKQDAAALPSPEPHTSAPSTRDSHPANTTALLCRGFYKFSAYRCCLSSSFPCNTFQGRSLAALPGSGAQGRPCPVTAAAGAGLGLQPTVRGPLCSGGSLRPDQPRRTLLFSSP